MYTYETNTVVDVSQESEGRQQVEELQFQLEADRQKEGQGDDGRNGGQKPAEQFATGVAHLCYNELAANVGEHNTDQEGKATRIPIQNAGRRCQHPNGCQGEEEQWTHQRP